MNGWIWGLSAVYLHACLSNSHLLVLSFFFCRGVSVILVEYFRMPKLDFILQIFRIFCFKLRQMWPQKIHLLPHVSRCMSFRILAKCSAGLYHATLMCRRRRVKRSSHKLVQTHANAHQDTGKAVPEEVLFIIPNPVKDKEEAKSLYYTDLVQSGSGAITETKLRQHEKRAAWKIILHL